MATPTRPSEYKSLFGGRRPSPTRAALSPPPPRPPQLTSHQLTELRPLMVKFYLKQYNSLLGVTGISYDFIYKLVIVELAEPDRMSLAMTCKTLLVDITAMREAAPPNYRPLVSRVNADIRPGGEYERWLLMLQRDLIPSQRIYCPYCVKIHKPQRAGLWRPFHEDGSEDHYSPGWSNSYRCAQMRLKPSHLHDFDPKFNALSLYWIYRYMEQKYRKGLGNFEYDHLVSSLGLDETQLERPAGADRHLYTMRHSAKVTLQGIFLREKKTLLLYRPTRAWEERVNICWHAHYVIQPVPSFGTGPCNYLVTVRMTGGQSYAGPYISEQSFLIADNGIDLIHHTKPFNCLYSCDICLREWLIEPVARPFMQQWGMYAGLRITVWLCVAWYDLPRRRPREVTSPPGPVVPIQEIISNMREPHRRIDITDTPSVVPGTSAKAFEGYDFFDRAQQDTRYIFP